MSVFNWVNKNQHNSWSFPVEVLFTLSSLYVDLQQSKCLCIASVCLTSSCLHLFTMKIMSALFTKPNKLMTNNICPLSYTNHWFACESVCSFSNFTIHQIISQFIIQIIVYFPYKLWIIKIGSSANIHICHCSKLVCMMHASIAVPLMWNIQYS